MSLPGLCEGHMIEDGDHLLLLSQAVQAKLGVVTDVRDGTICMKDYAGQHLEVAPQIRTGLFMVRIDHLENVEDYLNPVKAYACEALRALVIDEDFDITNPEFLAKKGKDMFRPTASIAARGSHAASSFTTTGKRKQTPAQIQAKFDNIIGFAADGYPVERVRGASGLTSSSDEEVVVSMVTDDQRAEWRFGIVDEGAIRTEMSASSMQALGIKGIHQAPTPIHMMPIRTNHQSLNQCVSL